MSAPKQDEEYDRAIVLIRERVRAFVTGRIGREVAEDIAQGCVVVLMEENPHVRDRESMLKLAIGIARNKIYEHCRRQSRTQSLEGVEPVTNPATPITIEQEQIVNLMLSAMLKLSERCQALLRMRLASKTTSEIQALLGAKSIFTVFGWQKQCFKKLLENMGGTVYGK
jgi:RNA polymerase sigma factor (sigma-70 family)